MKPLLCAPHHGMSPSRNSSPPRPSHPTPWIRSLTVALLFLTTGITSATFGAQAADYQAPVAIVAAPDGASLYVACEASGEVLVVDTEARKVSRHIAVGPNLSGLALRRDGSRLYATLGGPNGEVAVIDVASGAVPSRWKVGHSPQQPALNSDGRQLYVCNRFNHTVSVLDTETGRELRRIRVPREPFSAAPTPDGHFLLVANHLPAGRSDADVVAATVSVVDLETGTVAKELQLPNGSTMLRELRVSPDGRYAVVVHILARFHLPTTQIERGWINSNAASLIDLAERKLINTVLLDNVDSGASTPWAVAWTPDGAKLLVTHAGTHELSVIDFPGLLAKLARIPREVVSGQPVDYTSATRTTADVPNDLAFLVTLRRRIRLEDQGPRALVVARGRAWAASYFGDTLDIVDVVQEPAVVERLALGAAPKLDIVRLGERHFNDATLCFQGWQACSSCHSHDARVDGMNWDNLNDGIGNPKNSKSLLFAHETPPSMALGVRSNAALAVRMGIRNSLFTVQPPAVANAMDAYLAAIRPIPSPHLVDGQLSPSAERGRQLFANEKVGCAECHSGKYFTDLRFHDVGTISKYDSPTNRFDTPTLIETWRSGPYLHDGSAATMREVLVDRNARNAHGNMQGLTDQQIQDLAEYVLSL